MLFRMFDIKYRKVSTVRSTYAVAIWRVSLVPWFHLCCLHIFWKISRYFRLPLLLYNYILFYILRYLYLYCKVFICQTYFPYLFITFLSAKLAMSINIYIVLISWIMMSFVIYYYYYYYYNYYFSCHRPILPGNSLEPTVIPTAQASSFTLQYFPYYV